MKKQNVYAAIIGGGAGGMMCAIRAAERHPKEKIVILEKADRVGKKLLVTGNGRCNLSHVGADARSYHGEGSAEFINILFKKYNTNAVLRFFSYARSVDTHRSRGQGLSPVKSIKLCSGRSAKTSGRAFCR
jgi:predicted flavoprotein YhiN